jgi:hypothetical protein
MGLRPTHGNESQHVTPAKAGVHVLEELDSRFRGNDVTFDAAQGGSFATGPAAALQGAGLAAYGWLRQNGVYTGLGRYIGNGAVVCSLYLHA